MTELEEQQRTRVIVLLCVASGVMAAYWVAWFAHRSLVASATGTPYTWFENAFPAADGLLIVFMLLAARALRRRQPTALLWLLLGSGGGLYLFLMDVLYDLEQGIWTKGANGLTELAINILTISLSILVGGFAWRNREALASNSDSTR